MPADITIELKGVSKWFPMDKGERLYVVQDLNLDIRASALGEIVVLLGPSGCGKTTILKLIAGLTFPNDGEVIVGNQRVTGPGATAATVPQGYPCFPWLSVLGNVEFGLRVKQIGRKLRRELATHYLELVGLADRLDFRPGQLSNGMQQRVAIARTLAMRRSIVLMDEPFGALDAQTRWEMQQLLLDLWRAEKNLIIFVTHDITEALYLADRIVVFSHRPARALADLRTNFPRPRGEELQHSREFVEHVACLRQLLRENPEAARAAGQASK